MKSRICVARFGLTKNQWINFNKFYKDNPKGILRKKDLGNRTIRLKKYNYIGGCILIMPKQVYNCLSGFNVKYGHRLV